MYSSYRYVTRGEVQENRYTKYIEDFESQRRGWLPTTLPRSATQIHELHEIDTNLCFGSFRFDPSERSAIELTLRPGLRRPLRIDRDPSFAVILPRDPSGEQLASAGYEFYLERDFAYAINWTSGIAYFWNSFS